MKLTILIFSFFFSFFIFSQSEITEENMELDSIHYRCYTVQQTTTSQGKSETITKRICEKRIHEIYSKGKKYIYKASFFDSLGEIISITNITMEGSNKIREGVNSQMIANITYERILNDSSKFQKYIDIFGEPPTFKQLSPSGGYHYFLNIHHRMKTIII